MKPLARAFCTPKPYVGWAALVVVTLGCTAVADAHVFGFTVFFLAAVSGLVGIVGLAVVLFSSSLSTPRKKWIVSAIGVTAAAVFAALAYLATFHWA